jgi:MFS family permease
MTGLSYEAGSLDASSANWADLFSGRHLAVVSVMAGGILLYAMNLYFTAALMPSIVMDIGGQNYYAWVTTAFVIAAIVASLFVSRVLDWKGAASAYVIAFTIFALGAIDAAISPTMELLIAARVVQGLGGGLLAGLGYAVIRSALPEKLWARATAVVSAMWGLGTLFGPSLGGVFAEFGLWRWAYAALAVAALLLAVIARGSFKQAKTGGYRAPVPFASLIPLLLAIIAISVSSILPIGLPTLIAVAIGILLLIVFVSIERGATNTILPRITYLPGNSLKWTYLTVAALSAGVMLENFIPLFSQQLAGLSPLLAGLLGAVLSLAWVIAQLFAVSINSEVTRRRAIRLGPLLLAVGLIAYSLLLIDHASTATVLLWTIALGVAGVGIGISWPLLGVAAMSSTNDPAEGGKAAAAITTTQLIAFSITSAIAGTLMSAGDGTPLNAATNVSLGIAILCVLGIASAGLATRKRS